MTKAGGKSLGHVLAPFQSTDFSSYLLQAQGSGAQVVALANSGGDTINAIKQASEFGLTDGGQKLVALLAFISDIHSVGLKVAHGLTLTEAFYWDLNDGNPDLGEAVRGTQRWPLPDDEPGRTYAAMLHWMKAIAALDKDKAHRGTDVVAQMKAMPTDDPLFGHGSIRADGRTIHDLYLFQVKDPSESKGPYDYYKLVDTIPGDQAFRPMADGGCPLVAHTAAK